jgi:DNA excision repair protein ERCC-4
MTSHYEICILLIEFEEDKFGLRVSESGGEREREGKRERERERGRETERG